MGQVKLDEAVWVPGGTVTMVVPVGAEGMRTARHGYLPNMSVRLRGLNLLCLMLRVQGGG